MQHFWEDDTVAGKIFFDKTKNRPVLQLAKAEEKYAKRGEHKTLDRINTIFDWIGFIPGIGDIVDVINGFIYYYRCTVLKEDKWLDVILSAIAAIPFLGSAVAISARAILKTSSEDGYLIASSQGNSTFNIYERRAPYKFIGYFKIEGNTNIDGVSDTDGLEIINTDLNKDFPDGILVVQDGDNTFKDKIQKQNFKFLSLKDLKQHLISE